VTKGPPTELPADVFAEGLEFLESPRWRGDKLWFRTGEYIATVGMDRDVTVVGRLPTRIGGLGFIDGRALVVSKDDRRLVWMDTDGSIHHYADLGDIAESQPNEMLVTRDGRAYVGTLGYDVLGGEDPAPGQVMLVRPDGSKETVSHTLESPNGMALFPDERVLLVAEWGAARVSAFDVEPDGSLENQRIWAELPGTHPDGVWLDEAGGLWVSGGHDGGYYRLTEGGEVTNFVSSGDAFANACALGGPDGRTLFMMNAVTDYSRVKAKTSVGTIMTTTVEFAGVGLL
jgi:sugar lactone lactonase YvrE